MPHKHSVATAIAVALMSVFTPASSAEEGPLTFLVTSDSHYEAVEKIERNDRNRVTIERMNSLPGEAWPDKLGGGKIGAPRGVLALGDLIDDGDKAGETEIQWRHFEEQFGLDGTDGLLKYPVFEGWGNHDGPPEKFIKQKRSVQAEIKRRNVARLEKKLIDHVADNGLHYSWDWQGVHFVQANLYPADKQNAKVRYSLPWHDPQLALQFVKDDLAATVGDSGRPVVIMAHCGFDTDWWVAEDWASFYQAVKPYNVIAFFHGHTGTGVRKWKPEGEDQPLDVINTGQTEKGFFVVEVDQKRMRLGYYVKKDPAVIENPEWMWKFLFEKPIRRSADEPETSATVPTKNATKEKKPLRFAAIGDFGLDHYKTKSAAKKAKASAETPAPLDPEDMPVADDYEKSDKQRNPAQAAVARLVAEWKPNFVVTTGDNNYPKGEAKTIDQNIGKYYADFIGDYRGAFGKGSPTNRFFPVLGNHDWDAPKVRCQAYLDYFTLPGNERYYEFQQGPLHFFMLDNDGREPDGIKPGSKQHVWFTEAIAASRTPFQIVVAHHPPYSSGEHGGVPSAEWNFNTHGVDLMLCGHDHSYERIDREGVIYVVNGAGGAGLRKFKKPVEGSQVRYHEKHGAMRFDVVREGDEWQLHSRFFNVDGQEIDHFVVTRPATGKN
jgi:tartrate-resistant acid phosphatase type 5